MNETIFVITGESGCHSDQEMWVVAACEYSREANEFCSRLNEWLKSHGYHRDNSDPDRYACWNEPPSHLASNKREKPAECPYDENFVYDYDGAEYSVVEVRRGEPLLAKWLKDSGHEPMLSQT